MIMKFEDMSNQELLNWFLYEFARLNKGLAVFQRRIKFAQCPNNMGGIDDDKTIVIHDEEGEKAAIMQSFAAYNIQDVTHITTDNNYIELHLTGEDEQDGLYKEHPVLITLKKAMIWLSEEGFVRISRTTAVNMFRTQYSAEESTIILDNGITLKVSPYYKDKVDEAFKKANFTKSQLF